MSDLIYRTHLLLVVAGIHLWAVFRQDTYRFRYRQIGLTAGVLAVAFSVPLYSYLYLPPFDFLPYNIGMEIGEKNALQFFDSGFNDATETLFADDKPTYMIGLKDTVTLTESSKLTALHEAYEKGKIHLFVVTSRSGISLPGYRDIPVYFMDDVALKSILRTSAGVVAFTADCRIAGKWNLWHTPYRFERGYGKELSRERWKRGTFFGILVIMTGGLLYGRKKLRE